MSDAGVDAEPDQGPPFGTVVLFDTTIEGHLPGNGVDICGASAECEGERLLPTDVRLFLGDGEVCVAPGEGCSANRADPAAARDDGAQCEAASVPSDYVMLGLYGTLELDFERDLRGCTVKIVELLGSQEESFELYVCQRPPEDPPRDWWVDHCLNDAMPLVTGAGTVEVEVPAP